MTLGGRIYEQGCGVRPAADLRCGRAAGVRPAALADRATTPLPPGARDALAQVLEFWFFERLRDLTAKEIARPRPAAHSPDAARRR